MTYMSSRANATGSRKSSLAFWTLLLLCMSGISVSSAASVENCLDERGGRCYACEAGFSPNNLGIKCLDNTTKNCALFLDDAGTQCAICHCGYSLVSTGECVKAAIKNCAFQDSTGTKCLLCRSLSDGLYGGGLTDYGLNFERTECIDNTASKNTRCVEYAAGNLMCNKCGQGYLPNPEGVCTELKTPALWVNHCHTVDVAGEKCQKCQVGFTLDLKDSAFVPSNPCTEDTNYDLNCLRYPLGFDGRTYDFTKCIQCKWGYFLGDDSRCSTVNRYTGCTTAGQKSINILNDAGGCLTVPGTDYPTLTSDCILFVELTYDSSTKVHKCLERMPATVANDCTDLDPSTLQCRTSNDCFTNRAFDSQYKTCQTPKIEGCLITNGHMWCEVCLNGYSLREGRCHLNPPYNPNCKTWSAEACTECNDGYGTAPKCSGSPPIARCTVMNGSKCVRCADRAYKLNDAGTECAITFGGVPFCQEHEADFVCKTCYDTFTLSPDKKSCWKKLKNCRTLSAEGVCALCDRFDHALRLYPDQSYSCVPMATAGSYCQITMDGKSCETCKTHPSVSTTPNTDGNLLCTASAAILSGCLEFNDATSCKTCEWDHIQTADNKCYSLSKYRAMYAFQSSLWYDLEPCIEASNVNTCTKCDPTKDAGLLTFAAQSLNPSTSTVEMIAGGVMCVDNNRGHLAQAAQNNVKNCKTYSDSTDLGLCAACQDNYTKGGSGPETCTNAKDPNNRCQTMTATGCTKCRFPNLHPRIINGQCFTADQAVKACQTFTTGSTTECTECYPSHYLHPDTKTCISYFLNVWDSNNNPNCKTLAKDSTTNQFMCSACSEGYQLKSVSYTTNSVATQKAYCVPDPSKWTSCFDYRTNGLCKTCQTGLKLKGSYDTDKLSQQTCFNEVANCIQYELNTYSYCSTCRAPMAPDAYGWACITENTAIPRCLAHNRSDIKKCAICEDGFTAPDCVGIANCYITNKDINGKALPSCSVCISGYIKTVDGKCVLQLVDNCDVAYDSLLCAKCKDGFHIVVNNAHEVSSWYSFCQPNVHEGCAYANDSGSCIKCVYGEYGFVDGICIQNDGTPNFPLYCAHYTYNSDLKKFQCHMCEPGYGLNADQTYCLFNNQPCGKEGCYRYEAPVAFDSPAECNSYDAASLLSAIMAIILTLALLN